MEKSKRYNSIGCVAVLRLPQADVWAFYNHPATGTWEAENLGLMTYSKIGGERRILR